MGLTRRAVLPALCVVGVTVTAVSWLRKPPSYPVAMPLADPAGEPAPLHDLAQLTPTQPPRPLPAFDFTDAAGARKTLADFAGKLVVLNLWATWCQPCVAELPALARLARAGAADGIAVVALSSDRGGLATVQGFLAAHHLDLPAFVDPANASVQALGARGLPTTLLIDRAGRERARFEGAADWASSEARHAILALDAV